MTHTGNGPWPMTIKGALRMVMVEAGPVSSEVLSFIVWRCSLIWVGVRAAMMGAAMSATAPVTRERKETIFVVGMKEVYVSWVWEAVFRLLDEL